jgi:iron(III) transport system permease protein
MTASTSHPDLALVGDPVSAGSIELRQPRTRRVPAGVSQGVVWLVVVVVVVAPVLPLLYASVRSQPYYLPGGVWSLQPYRTLLADPAFWQAVKNTAIFAGSATAIAVGLGTTFAILCSRTNIPGGRHFGWLLLAPIIIPPLGLIVGWVAIYGQSGYLTGLVGRNLHLPVWNLSSLAGMSLLGGAVTVPIAYLVCRSALASSDSSLEDAARASGASTFTVIRRITVPMLRPAIINSCVLIFALSLEVLGIPLLLGTQSNINFYASYLYNGWNSGTTPDPPFVSAGAVLLLVVVLALLFLRNRLVGSQQRFIVAGGRGSGPHRPLDLGKGRWPASVVVGGFIALTSVIPILGLVLMSSVTALTTLVPPWHQWTGSNWAQIVHNGVFVRSLVDSLLIAVIGGAVTVLVVAVAALIAHRSRFLLRKSLAPVLVYPRTVPGIVLGIGFFWAFLMVNPPGGELRNNLFGMALALCVGTVTLAYIVIYPSLARLSTDFDRAASSAGASWWTISRSIVFPLLRPALIGAYVLVFITLLNDYAPVVFLQKQGTQVLGVTMLQYWEKGVVGPVAALAVVQVVIVGGALAVGSRFLKRVFRA